MPSGSRQRCGTTESRQPTTTRQNTGWKPRAATGSGFVISEPSSNGMPTAPRSVRLGFTSISTSRKPPSRPSKLSEICSNRGQQSSSTGQTRQAGPSSMSRTTSRARLDIRRANSSRLTLRHSFTKRMSSGSRKHFMRWMTPKGRCSHQIPIGYAMGMGTSAGCWSTRTQPRKGIETPRSSAI